MPVILIKFDINLIFKFGPCFEHSEEVLLPDRVRFHSSTCFVHEFKPLIITNLKATNDTAPAEQLPLVKFLIDFISHVVSARLHVEHLAALVQFVGDNILASKLSVLKAIKNADHEFAVVVIYK